MRPAAVIFDLDGTLADSVGDIAAAVNRTLARHGFPEHPVAAYGRFVGEGVQRLIERATPSGTDAPTRARILADYQADYAEHLLDRTVLFPGIPDVLDRLAAAGVAMGVLSNKPDVPTNRIVTALCGRWRFGGVVGERPGIPRKPDPASALALADALGAPPDRTAFVGDTQVDMLTARAASMRAVGVLWGFRPAEVLASGADAADTAEALARLLGV